MKKLSALLLICMMLLCCACSSETTENTSNGSDESQVYYEKAKTYAEQKDFMLAVEMMEKAGDYQDSKELLNEYKYAYAMDLIGFQSQFESPTIQDNYNLHTIASLVGKEDEYFDDYKEAYGILKELRDDGYGKNVEYLMELVRRDMGNA